MDFHDLFNRYNRYRLSTPPALLILVKIRPDNVGEALYERPTMSVQMQQFRVVGVNRDTGEDVSIVIDAATKAAAEVKAEQMQIETTHIVRLKQDEPAAPDEHELFSNEAAEALAGKRTDKLIEEVVPPEEPKQAPEPPAPQPAPAASKPPPNPVVAAITRPTHAAPSLRHESTGANVSGARAFGFVLLVLLGITAGAYFVLVHEPNKVQAEHEELVFGQDLFSDVIGDQNTTPPRDVRDAFGTGRGTPDGPPIAEDQQLVLSQQQPQSQADQIPALVLQSVVTSHEGRFAVINGKFYKEGSELAGCKLVSVANDWVLMERLGEQFVLQIEPVTRAE